jgi:hypothetical protein
MILHHVGEHSRACIGCHARAETNVEAGVLASKQVGYGPLRKNHVAKWVARKIVWESKRVELQRALAGALRHQWFNEYRKIVSSDLVTEDVGEVLRIFREVPYCSSIQAIHDDESGFLWEEEHCESARPRRWWWCCCYCCCGRIAEPNVAFVVL